MLYKSKSAEWLKPLSQGTDQIDKKTLEISKADDEVYTDLSILGEELPDHSPRFILLSYPLTMVCCLSLPLVYLLPSTASKFVLTLRTSHRHLVVYLFPTSCYTTCPSPATASSRCSTQEQKS